MSTEDIDGAKPRPWVRGQARDNIGVRDVDGAVPHQPRRMLSNATFDDYSDVTRSRGTRNLGQSAVTQKWQMDKTRFSPQFKHHHDEPLQML